LSQEPGYGLLDLSGDTVDGFPALHWEFVVDQNGQILRKEDEFFVDSDDGDGVAVLTQPADRYANDAVAFADLRQTLAMN
jgi:hypothetical protein